MASTPSRPNGIPPELGQTLGDRLKKSLRHSGLSVADMAEHIEVHRNTISGWLADRAKPMPIFLRVWADKCEVPIEWLRDGEWPNATPVKPVKRAPAKNVPVREAPAKRAGTPRAARRGKAGR
jgi:transcriptional regulator with XRE-family HTH domain